MSKSTVFVISRGVASAVLIVLAAVSAYAQTTSPPAPRISQTVVVTASAAPEPADVVARTVTVLTREDLEQMGIVSVVDALRLVPGVDAKARGPRDVQTDFSIRGATFGQSLILLDGVRMNDSQSGHHNGDMPAPLLDLDRIEIVNGAGSSVHGADALGGTINLISRRDPHMTGDISSGQFGLVSAQASISGHVLPKDWTLSGWGSRSSGFTFDREFALGGAALRGSPIPGLSVDIRHQRKAFGANGFYGVSPSKEWTDQTFGLVTWQQDDGVWLTQARVNYRDHGDHFRWDINRPGFAENTHRTDAVSGTVTIARDLAPGRRMTLGVDLGADWIRSSNLGDHNYRRSSGFAEIQWPLANRTVVQTGVRVDQYSTFGASWSPTVAASTWLGQSVRLRASGARAFRIPTFTELYYHDPANQGSADLRAEHGWTADAGLDWLHGKWSFSASPFRRWDTDVIDWLKPTVADLWRSTNVRDVTTTGVEFSASRRWRQAVIRAHYSALSVDAPELSQLSKYVTEYTRNASGVSVAAPIAAGIHGVLNADHRHRADGQDYWVVDAHLARTFGRADVYIDATNLGNTHYVEVPGVAMPGRWVSIGLTLR